MAVVDVAIAAGSFLTAGAAEGAAAGIIGGAAIGAGTGALYSGITGDGNILNSALTGAAIGGAFGGIGAAAGLTGASGTSLGLSGTGALSGVGSTLGLAGTAVPAATPALAAASAIPEVASGTAAFGGAGAASIPVTGDAGIAALSAPATVAPAAAPTASTLLSTQTAPLSAELDAAGYGGTSNGVLNQVAGTAPYNPAPSMVGPASTGLTNMEMLGYGLAGTTALSLLGSMNQKKIPTQPIGQNPAYIRPSTYNISQNPSAYPTGPQYGANGLPILPTSEKSYFNQSYTAGTPYKAAVGGLMSSPDPSMMQTGPADVNFMGGDMYPTSQQNRSYYATPTQMPTSAQEAMASYEPKTNPLTGELMKNMASGGIADAYNLGSYSDGGRLLKGPGDGVSDDIPAVIGDKQPARLADGEFVIPARIVSELGNGSTDAGAKRLYAMMDRVQAGRKKTVGKDKVAVNTKADKHLPA